MRFIIWGNSSLMRETRKCEKKKNPGAESYWLLQIDLTRIMSMFAVSIFPRLLWFSWSRLECWAPSPQQTSSNPHISKQHPQRSFTSRWVDIKQCALAWWLSYTLSASCPLSFTYRAWLSIFIPPPLRHVHFPAACADAFKCLMHSRWGSSPGASPLRRSDVGSWTAGLGSQ